MTTPAVVHDASSTMASAPPALVSQYIEQELLEVDTLAECIQGFLDGGRVEEAVGMLEASHRKIVHLGKLADIQAVHHGVPLHGEPRDDGPPLPPREEALVAFSQMLLAFHLDPAWADEELAATLAAAAAGVPPARAGAARRTVGASAAGGTDAADVEAAAAFAQFHASGAAGGGGENDAAAAALAPAGAGAAPQFAADGGGALDAAAAAAVAAAAGAPILAPTRSKWSVDEIALFEQGLELYGDGAPTNIARLMGTRTGEQVRERIRTARKRAAKLAGAAAT